MVCAYNLGIWEPEGGELEVLSDLGLYSDTLHQNTYIRKIPSSYISYMEYYLSESCLESDLEMAELFWCLLYCNSKDCTEFIFITSYIIL